MCVDSNPYQVANESKDVFKLDRMGDKTKMRKGYITNYLTTLTNE